ncbi:hypothetical protein GGR33_003245 [Methylobacterium brachythecii]|nr:hypothetical protein [Methylobacterium brachythecii]
MIALQYVIVRNGHGPTNSAKEADGSDNLCPRNGLDYFLRKLGDVCAAAVGSVIGKTPKVPEPPEA